MMAKRMIDGSSIQTILLTSTPEFLIIYLFQSCSKSVAVI